MSSCRKVAVLISALALIAMLCEGAPSSPKHPQRVAAAAPSERAAQEAEAEDLQPAASGYGGLYGGGWGGHYGGWGGGYYGGGHYGGGWPYYGGYYGGGWPYSYGYGYGLGHGLYGHSYWY